MLGRREPQQRGERARDAVEHDGVVGVRDERLRAERIRSAFFRQTSEGARAASARAWCSGAAQAAPVKSVRPALTPPRSRAAASVAAAL